MTSYESALCEIQRELKAIGKAQIIAEVRNTAESMEACRQEVRTRISKIAEACLQADECLRAR